MIIFECDVLSSDSSVTLLTYYSSADISLPECFPRIATTNFIIMTII